MLLHCGDDDRDQVAAATSGAFDRSDGLLPFVLAATRADRPYTFDLLAFDLGIEIERLGRSAGKIGISVDADDHGSPRVDRLLGCVGRFLDLALDEPGV